MPVAPRPGGRCGSCAADDNGVRAGGSKAEAGLGRVWPRREVWAAPTPEQRAQTVHKFMQWFRQNGGYVAKGVELHEFPGGLRGWRTTEPRPRFQVEGVTDAAALAAAMTVRTPLRPHFV